MKDAKGHGSEPRGAGFAKPPGPVRRPLPGHPYHTKTNDELRYIIKDASAAELSTRGMSSYNPNSGKREDTSGKYADQVNDAASILGYRTRGGKSDAPSDALASGPKSAPAPIHDSMVGAKGANGHYVIPGGQGHDPSHASSPLAGTAMAKGYSYSHSTPIHMQDGSVQTHHTYARGEHKVGVTGNKWQTSVSSGSGHRTSGTGAASLAKHLASKASRYPGLKG